MARQGISMKAFPNMDRYLVRVLLTHKSLQGSWVNANTFSEGSLTGRYIISEWVMVLKSECLMFLGAGWSHPDHLSEDKHKQKVTDREFGHFGHSTYCLLAVQLLVDVSTFTLLKEKHYLNKWDNLITFI